MASLAGMLKERRHRVTGSDAAAYPPMSDFLRDLGIPVAQPFDVKNLDPAPDLVVVGNAISRGNAELEHVLDQRIPFCSLPQLLHDEFLRGKEVRKISARAFVSGRDDISSSKATSTIPPSSTRDRNSCTTFPMPSS